MFFLYAGSFAAEAGGVTAALSRGFLAKTSAEARFAQTLEAIFRVLLCKWEIFSPSAII